MDNGNVDRRRHKRVKVDRSIIADSAFVALDLSESGMRIASDTEYRKGRELVLKLVLDGEELSLKAEIMWCQKASSIYETGFHIGVQFKDHSIGQQLLIRNYVEENL